MKFLSLNLFLIIIFCSISAIAQHDEPELVRDGVIRSPLLDENYRSEQHLINQQKRSRDLPSSRQTPLPAPLENTIDRNQVDINAINKTSGPSEDPKPKVGNYSPEMDTARTFILDKDGKVIRQHDAGGKPLQHQ